MLLHELVHFRIRYLNSERFGLPQGYVWTARRAVWQKGWAHLIHQDDRYANVKREQKYVHSRSGGAT